MATDCFMKEWGVKNKVPDWSTVGNGKGDESFVCLYEREREREIT